MARSNSRFDDLHPLVLSGDSYGDLPLLTMQGELDPRASVAVAEEVAASYSSDEVSGEAGPVHKGRNRAGAALAALHESTRPARSRGQSSLVFGPSICHDARMREGRRHAFEVMRRKNNVADGSRTPAERLRDSNELIRIADMHNDLSGESRTDEPIEFWRRLLAKVRL